MAKNKLFEEMKNLFPKQENQKGGTVRRLVDIGRNDPCPCGSGKKYKKCCARVRSEKPEEYYLEQMSEVQKMSELYEIARKAEQDHPLSPRFSYIIAIYALQQENVELAREHLHKLWRLMKARMPVELVMPLVSLLQMEGDWQQAEEIIETCLQQERSPDLLLQLALMRINNQQIDEGVELAREAADRKEEVKDDRLWVALLQELFISRAVVEALKMWLDNWSLFQNLKTQQNFAINEVIKEFLQEQFSFSQSELEEKELKKQVRKLMNILELFNSFEQARQNNKRELALDYLAQIKDMISGYTKLKQMLVNTYFEVGAREQVLDLTEELPVEEEDRVFYLRSRARAFRELGQGERARECVEQAFSLITEQKIAQSPETFSFWPVIGEYVLVLLQQKDASGLADLIARIRSRVEVGETELNTIMRGLEGYSVKQVLSVLEQLMVLNSQKELFDEEELYVNYLYTLILELERANREQKQVIERITTRVKNALQKGEEKGYYTPLLDYGHLMVENEQLSEDKKRSLLQEIITKPASFEEEIAVKYEAVIRYSQRQELPEINDPVNALAQEYHHFYRILFYLKNNELEQAKELLIESEKREQVLTLLQNQSQRFLNSDKLTELMKEIEKEVKNGIKNQAKEKNQAGIITPNS
ncbi:MAG: SEC-C metal-binding domain-containing protein [Bacillota bacterium]